MRKKYLYLIEMHSNKVLKELINARPDKQLSFKGQQNPGVLKYKQHIKRFPSSVIDQRNYDTQYHFRS